MSAGAHLIHTVSPFVNWVIETPELRLLLKYQEIFQSQKKNYSQCCIFLTFAYVPFYRGYLNEKHFFGKLQTVLRKLQSGFLRVCVLSDRNGLSGLPLCPTIVWLCFSLWEIAVKRQRTTGPCPAGHA